MNAKDDFEVIGEQESPTRTNGTNEEEEMVESSGDDGQGQ